LEKASSVPQIVIVYTGWVGGREIDWTELREMGVEIFGQWNPIGAFDHVRMSEEVYKVFCKRWQGRYVWGLRGKKEEKYTEEEMEDIPF
jgi:hypothetical protein